MSRDPKSLSRQIKWRWKNLRGALAAPLAYPPGHFYSPVTSPSEIERLYRDPAAAPAPLELAGIAINRDAQLALWESWRGFLAGPRPGAGEGCRYRPVNDQYGLGDATVQNCILRHARPRRIIEVGSGHSSAAMLDTIDRDLGGDVRCTFIDPHPQRLVSVLRAGDMEHCTIIASGIQDADPALVDALEADDLLFIDSTHIVKTASDVVWDLFELLPHVKSGVYVHFHDMFWPFEYPAAWVRDMNLSWNELYAVRAFLSYNSAFEIVFFGDYLWKTARAAVNAAAPDLRDLGGGLWLRRR